MNDARDNAPDLVSLAEAERLCCRKLGMSPEQFRHELARHVRGAGGLPWTATEAAAGVDRAALERFLAGGNAGANKETDHDR